MTTTFDFANRYGITNMFDFVNRYGISASQIAINIPQSQSIQSCLNLRFITEFVSRVTRRVPLVEQRMPSLPVHLRFLVGSVLL